MSDKSTKERNMFALLVFMLMLWSPKWLMPVLMS